MTTRVVAVVTCQRCGQKIEKLVVTEQVPGWWRLIQHCRSREIDLCPDCGEALLKEVTRW